jgi:hypothetical protein
MFLCQISSPASPRRGGERRAYCSLLKEQGHEIFGALNILVVLFFMKREERQKRKDQMETIALS